MVMSRLVVFPIGFLLELQDEPLCTLRFERMPFLYCMSFRKYQIFCDFDRFSGPVRQ